MKKNYEKPIILANSELSEGIFAASGMYGGSDCYTTNAYIHQTPETGRGDYRIQVDGHHSDMADHSTDSQVLTVVFNQPVVYNGTSSVANGDGTYSIYVDYSYHNNPNDNIGLGELIVESDPGLTIVGANLTCGN